MPFIFTGADFQSWMDRLTIQRGEAANLLGKTDRTIRTYQDEPEKVLSKTTCYACAYIEIQLLGRQGCDPEGYLFVGYIAPEPRGEAS